ncbi:hypothetical protein MEO93_25075 [Dolichospermum sp. ST_sed3]|nr:hypothetical protein [Dolichospermum sp. ST_sed3]
MRKVYGETILAKNSEPFKQIGEIKFKYFISTDFTPIQPPEARGLKIRNLNVGVGSRTFLGVGIEGRTYASQSNITGEVIVWEGLNDLITLNREDFNFSPDYESFRQYLRENITLTANTLDDISDISKISKQTEDDFKLLSLDFLDPEKLRKKIEVLEEKGFAVRYLEQNEDFKKIEIDKKKKRINIYGNLQKNLKKVKLGDRVYNLEITSWEYKNSHLPACKIIKDRIIVNENYPLFHGRKYLDVFFKIHVLLLLSFKAETINQETHNKLINQILDLFSDYIK